VGYYSDPCFIDIDADGDYDLFITDDEGHFYYYRNNGTAQSPNYSLVTSQWQGIYFPPPNSAWRGFCFSDLDQDNDLDLPINSGRGHISFYRNIGTPFIAIMQLETNDFLEGYDIGATAINLVDIDQDNDNDLFIGEGYGGIMFFRNMGLYEEAEITIELSGNNIILTRGNIAEAVEYRIFYQDTPYFAPAGTPQAIVMPPDTSWVDENAVMQGNRYYRVVVEY
jgi:hypothetical protein